MKYNVLWIDNEPSDSFMDNAYNNFDLNIINKENYVEGMEWLEENRENCYAVILDVNCVETSSVDESESMDVFTDYLPHVIKLCERQDHFIPWYVYTAGGYEGYETLKRTITGKRDWDPKKEDKYYRKPKDSIELLQNIKTAIVENARYVQKYKDLFELFPDLEHKSSLLRIIEIVEENKTSNSSAYNDIRKILEAVTDILKIKGFFPDDLDGLSSASYYIRQICIKGRQFLVPSYISYCYTACEDICNDGSHNGGKTPMKVDKDTSSYKAPYLIRSTFFMLSNIIVWASKLSATEDSITYRKQKVAEYNIPKFERNRKTE